MKNKLIVNVGIFSAIAFVLQLLVPYKVSGFLDVELSDVPAVLISLAEGPLAGIFVELIKNILHLTISTTGFVGELANFIVNGTFVFVLGLIYKFNKTKTNAIFSFVMATVSMVLTAILVNLFIMLPLYMKSADKLTMIKITLTTITPFNIGKCMVISIITFFIYKRVSKVIK